MTKYHISRRTGKPSICRATSVCPFGDLETEHYSTYVEAQAAYEEKMKEYSLASFKAGQIRITKVSKNLKKTANSVQMPKGLYVIGNISHIISKDPNSWNSWKKTVSEDGDGFKNNVLGASYNNMPVIAIQTPMDNSILYDNSGKSYGTSEGMIGIIPLSLIKKLNISKEEIEEDSHVHNFTEDTLVEFNTRNGSIKCGDGFKINTEPDEEDLEFDWAGELEKLNNKSSHDDNEDVDKSEKQTSYLDKVTFDVDGNIIADDNVIEEPTEDEEYQNFLKLMKEMGY